MAEEVESVPYSRFKEVNDQKNELKEQLNKVKADQVAEIAKYNDRIKKLESSLGSVDALNTKIGEQVTEIEKLNESLKGYQDWEKGVYDTKLAGLDEGLRDLIPEGLSIREKIAHIEKISTKMSDYKKKNVGGTLPPADGTTPSKVDINNLKSLTPEEYEKHKKELWSQVYKK